MELETLALIGTVITTIGGFAYSFVQRKELKRVVNIVVKGSSGTIVYEKITNPSSEEGISVTQAEKIEFADAWIPVAQEVHALYGDFVNKDES